MESRDEKFLEARGKKLKDDWYSLGVQYLLRREGLITKTTEENRLEVSGEKLQDRDYTRTVKATLKHQGLITREVVERVIYIGFPELKFFEERQSQYGPYLAEGSLRAILEDEDPHSPSREIRRLVDEEVKGLASNQVAFNDLKRIAQEGRLEQIQGVGPQRRQFIEHFVAEAQGENYYAGPRQPVV